MATPARSDSFTIEVPVPVLAVTDVARSMRWYAATFGFFSDPFPEQPPHAFAILRRDRAEIMLQCLEQGAGATPAAGWSVYLRISGGRLLELAAAVAEQGTLLRGPERAFYGQVEFEVADPDGYVICVAEALPAEVDVPLRQE